MPVRYCKFYMYSGEIIFKRLIAMHTTSYEKIINTALFTHIKNFAMHPITVLHKKAPAEYNKGN